MHQPQIKANKISITGLGQQLIQGAEVGDGALLPAAQSLGLIQHLNSAEEIGQLIQSGTGGPVPVVRQKSPQGGEVLALNQGADLLRRLVVDLHLRGQGPVDAGMANLNVKLLHTAGAQGVHRSADHLQIGPDATGADQLYAALGDLTVAAPVGVAGPVDVLIVIKALGQRQVLQLGGRHPGDGDGAVRPHHADLAGAVDHLQHGLLGNGAAAGDKAVVKLHLRGDDLSIAPGAEEMGQPGLNLTALPALVKEPVPGPLRGIGNKFHGQTRSFTLVR